MTTDKLFPFMERAGGLLSNKTNIMNGYCDITGTGELEGIDDYGMLIGFDNAQMFFPLNANNQNFMYFRVRLSGTWKGWRKVTGVEIS